MDFVSILTWVLQGIAGMLITVLWTIIRDLKHKIEKTGDDLSNKIDKLEDNLSAHKIEAAGKYLTRDELKSVVDSVNQALEKHGDRLDTRLDRLEKHLMERR